MYEIAKKAVAVFLGRNPSLERLRDDLVSVAHIAIAERPDAGESELYNAVNSVIHEHVTEELQGVDRRTFRRHGPGIQHVPLTKDVEFSSHGSLSEWLECCATEMEEAVIRMSWSNYTATQISQQLECTTADVELVQRLVARRFADES